MVYWYRLIIKLYLWEFLNRSTDKIFTILDKNPVCNYTSAYLSAYKIYKPVDAVELNNSLPGERLR